MGRAKGKKKNYSHRKVLLQSRLLSLAESFAVDIHGFAIMSNHFHVVVRFDPLESERWSDEEVAQRWIRAFGSPADKESQTRFRNAVDALSRRKRRLGYCRKRLGCLSAFMQHVKQPIARRANLEDGVSGHFFEQRFYSGALLSEKALLAAMVYVDLNPVRAGITQEIKRLDHTSLSERLRENCPKKLKSLLQPIAAGINAPENDSHGPEITLKQYISLLRDVIAVGRGSSSAHPDSAKQALRWAQYASLLSKRQRAFGDVDELSAWLDKRGFRHLEIPFK
ncbi:MAG: hypothetical protein AAF493_14195 [Pseudomonadota bacterium]